jgi:hypothetical protein
MIPEISMGRGATILDHKSLLLEYWTRVTDWDVLASVPFITASDADKYHKVCRKMFMRIYVLTGDFYQL